MGLLAKSVIKNKCWVVEEDNGKKIGTILANSVDFTFVKGRSREHYPTLKRLSDRYNIRVDKSTGKKEIKESYDVYDYPCDHNAKNALWNVQLKLPVFTKGTKSKSFFCAGYYLIQFNLGWVKSYCPKLITVQRYGYQGPFKTEQEMKQALSEQHGR
jgi:hypothetical protein